MDALRRLYWIYADMAYRRRSLDLAHEVMEGRISVAAAVDQMTAYRAAQAAKVA